MRPATIAHADWGTAPGKRWVARATWRGDHYRVDVPRPVGFAAILPHQLVEAGPPALLGLDLPLGIPEAYARRAGIDDFAALLPRLGRGQWSEFYEVAEKAEQISLTRPFYPYRPGGTKRHYLTEALGLDTFDDLRRRCDRPRPGRRAAAPIFWTLGAQQVGKAAIAAWRELLAPALQSDALRVGLWPFDGPLEELNAACDLVMAETYPGEMYDHLALPLARSGSKRRHADRQASGAALLTWAEQREGVELERHLQDLLRDGFGSGAEMEDPFDAVVGVMGMINVVLGGRPAGPPALHQQPWLPVEGWILGQIEGDGV